MPRARPLKVEEPSTSCSSLAFGDSQGRPEARQPEPARVSRWMKKCVTFLSSAHGLYQGPEIVSVAGGAQCRREPSKMYSYWIVGWDKRENTSQPQKDEETAPG